MNVLFDFHTVVASPYSGKFNNMMRFPQCLSADSHHHVRVVLDRRDGNAPIPTSMAHEFLRTWSPGYVASSPHLAYLWLRRLRKSDFDRLFTEVVLSYGHWLVSFFEPDEDAVLHVDFQGRTLRSLPGSLVRRMKRFERFHVLTYRQRDALVRLGFPEDAIHIIPNCVDPTPFRRRGSFKERCAIRKPLALYVHGAGSDPRILRSVLHDLPVALVTVGCPTTIPGAIQFGRVPGVLYLDILTSADLAVCLTPSGDTTTTRLFEFAMAGLPFVAADPSDGMVPLLPSGYYGMLRENVKELVEDEGLRSEVSRRLRSEAQEFTYDRTLPKLRRLVA